MSRRKFSSALSEETWMWRLASSPVSFLERVLGLLLLIAAYDSGDAAPVADPNSTVS
jgi:hypothetical protein